MSLTRWYLPAALLALVAGTASADVSTSSPFSRQTSGFETTVAAIVPAGSPRDPNAPPAPPAYHERSRWVIRPVAPSGTRNDAIRYRRRGSYARPAMVETPMQLHLGYFDPHVGLGNSFLVGFRGGPMVDPHVQVGVSFDWMHRGNDETVVAGDPYSQGGTIVTPTRVLARASTDLLPMQAFIQVTGDENMSLIPYGGIGGGYHVLFLSADDFSTGTSYDATFGGWGWQAWAGLGIPLSGRARLNGEFYVNQSEPEREVRDEFGFAYRERVDGDGVGIRGGIQWGW